MTFVQIIEIQTTKLDEFHALLEEWMEISQDWRTATKSILTKDRDRPDTYVQLVKFPSFEKAQENSNRPETGELAKRLAAICDAPPAFRNLDVLREETL